MNPIRPIFVMLILALVPGLATGQTVPAIPPTPTAPPADLRGSLSFSLENDLFNNTDRFYTNGVQLSWYSPSAELPQPLGWLNRQLDGVLGPGQLRWGAALGHSIFTPQDTERRNPDRRDRPYAGLLYGTVSLARDAGTSFTLFELQAGLIGPSALGRQVQNGFHALLSAAPSNGWDYQLRDEFVFGAVLSRTWRLPLVQFAGLQVEALPRATAALGTLQTTAAIGGILRIGQGLDADFGPARIRPALSGSAFFQPRSQNFGWYVFAGVEGRAVAHDVLLDGNTFRQSRSVDARPFVGDAMYGVAVMYAGVRLTYTQVVRTVEFYGQRGGMQRFASLSATFRF